MCAISIPAPPLKTSVAACHRRAPHLAAETYTSYQKPPKTTRTKSMLLLFFCFWEKKGRIKSHLVLYLSGKSQKKEHREYVLMPPIHSGRLAALSATAPRKTSKTHLHAKIVRHLYCILTFTKWRRGGVGQVRGERHLHF